MTAPLWVARLNKRVTNRLLGPLTRWLPGYAIVVHTGRRSGLEYRTPVKVFPRPGGFVIALTYGPRTEWVRNVLAAGGCRLITRGRTWRLTAPRLFEDRQRRVVPPYARLALRVLGVADFLDLSLVG